jgi:hypothetical protein
VDAFFTDSRELIEQADALARNYGRITRRGGMKRFLIEMDDDAWAAMCREQRVAYKCGDGAELCGIPPEDKDVFYDYLCRRSGADMVWPDELSTIAVTDLAGDERFDSKDLYSRHSQCGTAHTKILQTLQAGGEQLRDPANQTQEQEHAET